MALWGAEGRTQQASGDGGRANADVRLGLYRRVLNLAGVRYTQ